MLAKSSVIHLYKTSLSRTLRTKRRAIRTTLMYIRYFGHFRDPFVTFFRIYIYIRCNAICPYNPLMLLSCYVLHCKHEYCVKYPSVTKTHYTSLSLISRTNWRKEVRIPLTQDTVFSNGHYTIILDVRQQR